MKFFCATNFALVSMLALVLMPGEEQRAEGIHLELLLLLPALLLKIGLAAPIVLAILAKLLLLLGLKKKKAILLPTLLSSSSDDSSENSYGSDLGRIKRSVDFVQEIVGQTEVTEEQLLESILRVDTLRCGEKLLCEIATSATSARRNEAIDEDEAAMINLFAERDAARDENIGPALKVYRDALIGGIRYKDCGKRYPTCPFSRMEMMQLVHLVAGPEIPLQIVTSGDNTKTVPKTKDDTRNKEEELPAIFKV